MVERTAGEQDELSLRLHDTYMYMYCNSYGLSVYVLHLTLGDIDGSNQDHCSMGCNETFLGSHFIIKTINQGWNLKVK